VAARDTAGLGANRWTYWLVRFGPEARDEGCSDLDGTRRHPTCFQSRSWPDVAGFCRRADAGREASPVRRRGVVGISLPDPKQWAADVFNQVLVNLLNGFTNALRGVVSGVLGSSLNFITQTPPSGSTAARPSRHSGVSSG